MNDKILYIIIGIVCVIGGIILGGLLFGKDISDNRNRIDTAYEQLERVGEHQQSVDESLDTIRDGLDRSIDTTIGIEERNERIKESVDSATSNNESSIGLVRESTERIEQSKSILERVRERESSN